MRIWHGWLVSGLAMALAACGGAPPVDDVSGDEAVAATTDPESSTADEGDMPDSVAASRTAEASDAVSAPDTDASGLVDKAGSPVQLLPFDIDSVPLSDAALGELPFFSLPQGYAPVNHPYVRNYARFPFRIGDGLHWVEGRSWSAFIGIDSSLDRDKEYSDREVRRNLEAVFAQAGAQQVFAGELLRDLYYGPQLEDEIGGGFIDTVNMNGDTPTEVYVIHQTGRNVWIQVSHERSRTGLTVVEEIPFESTAKLQADFPYLSMPADYEQRSRPATRDFDMFPFWTGPQFEEIEGRTWVLGFGRTNTEYSVHEVRRNLEAMMDEAGATLVFDGRIPKAASESVDEDVKRNYADAADYVWDDYDTRVYRFERNGKQVWVFAKLDYLSAGYVVAEREGFVQSAALLPADALKQQLDTDGRVAIQVNFATDKADILPDSQPQLEQVLALLQQDPELSLAVEGHTDNTGSAEHNRSLSEARAQSVVAALTGKGIDALRLSAEGFGQERPIADNATEEGKAKNRRVELVRKP